MEISSVFTCESVKCKTLGLGVEVKSEYEMIWAMDMVDLSSKHRWVKPKKRWEYHQQ